MFSGVLFELLILCLMHVILEILLAVSLLISLPFLRK